MIVPIKVDSAGTRGASAGETVGAAAQAGGGDTPEKDTNSKMTTLDVPQWSMVELQGELLSKDALSGQAIGTMTSENGQPSLVIGNHKLEGKVASEPKPLLVMRKVILPEPDADDAEVDEDVNSAQRTPQRQQQQARVEYRIVGKIMSKTIFKTRPKPLIRKSSVSSSSTAASLRKK